MSIDPRRRQIFASVLLYPAAKATAGLSVIAPAPKSIGPTEAIRHLMQGVLAHPRQGTVGTVSDDEV